MNDAAPNSANSPVSLEEIFESLPVGVLVFDRDLKVIRVNKNFYLFDVVSGDSSNLEGTDINKTDLFDYSDLSAEMEELRKGIPFEADLLNLNTSEGKELKIIIKGTPLFANGKFNGGVLILEDVKLDSEVGVNKFAESKFLAEIVSRLDSYFVLTDARGNIVYKPKPKGKFSKIFKTEFGAIQEYFPDHDQKIEALINAGKTDDLKDEIEINLGKEPLILRLQIYRIQDKRYTSDFLIILFEDISQQVSSGQLVAAEIEELKFYQSITSNVVDALFAMDNDGNITFWNDSADVLFGFKKSAVFGKHISKILPKVSPELFVQIKKEITKSNFWESEFRITKGSFEENVIQIRFGASDAEEGAVVALCTNISERYNIEREIRESEERYRKIVTNSHEYICIVNVDESISYVNPFFAERFGYNVKEFLKLRISDLIAGEQLSERKFRFSEITSDEIFNIELPLKTNSGEIRYVNASFSLVLDMNKKPAYYNAIFTDITETREAERDLRLIGSVFGVSQDGICVQTGEKILLANDSFAAIYGYKSSSEITGNDFESLVAEESLQTVRSISEAVRGGVDSPKRIEFQGIKKSGELRTIEETITSFSAGGESFLVRIERDITDEKIAEQALKESEEKYRSVAENITEGMWKAERIDGKLTVVFYTEAIQKITGYSSADFLNDTKLWYRIIHPEDLQSALARMKKLYTSASKLFDDIEYRIISRQGTTVWIKNKISLIRSDGNQIQKIYGVVSNVTISKTAEEKLKKSAEDLSRTNETKDRLLSIISHDLRSPFSSIIGFTDILLKNPEVEVEKRNEYVGFINESAKSILDLVNSLLDWTRIQTGRIKFEPDRLNLKEVADKSIKMLSGTALQKNIGLISEINVDTYAHADENLLLQVLNNLISNSIKFTDDGGTISVSASPRLDMRSVEMRVTDTGVGIRKEDQDKLFRVDTKFTNPGTKGEKGTGLGLSLCYDIIKKHGGDIRVESELGRGTEFIFTLPVASTNILFVDDAKTDRLLYSKLLKSFFPEYNIVTANDGKQAMEIMRQSTPAVVITDHFMPVMDGFELVRQIQTGDLKMKPPIVILSINLTEDIVETYREMGIEFIFQKPVNLTAFRIAIDKSLKQAIFS